MTSLSLKTDVSSFLPQPPITVLRPSPSVTPAMSKGDLDSILDCREGPRFTLCSDISAFSVPAVLGSEVSDTPSEEPLPARMPFADPHSILPTATITLTVAAAQTASRSTVQEADAAAMSSVPQRPTPGPTAQHGTSNTTKPILTTLLPIPASADRIMRGNPEPKHPKLHTPIIVGIAIVSVLGLSIVPLLVFLFVIKIKLKRAIKRHLAQGPRGRVQGRFNNPEEVNRDFAVDGRFLAGFRRRIHDRAFIGRPWV